MASNGAAQTAAAQQGNQQQAEQFLQQQQQAAFANLQKYMAQNPTPVSQWGQLQGPNATGGQVLGGGTAGASGITPPPAPHGPPQRHPMSQPFIPRITQNAQPAAGSPQGGAQNALAHMMQGGQAAHGTSGANSSTTSPDVSPQIKAAAQTNPQFAAYLQAYEMMRAKNQTQMHGGGIG